MCLCRISSRFALFQSQFLIQAWPGCQTADFRGRESAEMWSRGGEPCRCAQGPDRTGAASPFGSQTLQTTCRRTIHKLDEHTCVLRVPPPGYGRSSSSVGKWKNWNSCRSYQIHPVRLGETSACCRCSHSRRDDLQQLHTASLSDVSSKHQHIPDFLS